MVEPPSHLAWLVKQSRHFSGTFCHADLYLLFLRLVALGDHVPQQAGQRHLLATVQQEPEPGVETDQVTEAEPKTFCGDNWEGTEAQPAMGIGRRNSPPTWFESMERSWPKAEKAREVPRSSFSRLVETELRLRMTLFPNLTRFCKHPAADAKGQKVAHTLEKLNTLLNQEVENWRCSPRSTRPAS